MAARRAPLPLRVRLYIWLVSGAAILLLLWWRQAWNGPAPEGDLTPQATLGLMALMVSLAITASHVRLHIARGQDVQMANAVFFACLLLFGAPAAMLLVAMSVLLGEMTLSVRRHAMYGTRLRSAHQVVFESGQWMLTTGAGGLVYHALAHAAGTPLSTVAHLMAVPAAAGTMYLTNTWLVAGVIALQRGEHPLDTWRAGRRRDVLQEAGLYLLGLIAARTAAQDAWMPLLLTLPVAIIYVSLKRSVQLEEQTIAAVEALADVVDRRDRYTFEHSRRVADYAVRLARALRLPAGEMETIRLAARVHDLGKIGVPDHVLLKQGPLTPEEQTLMRGHPEAGYEILSRFAEYRRGRELVRSHHEWFNGGGYPHGAHGSALPAGAQIIAVADALDAMTSDRPYRKGLPLEAALQELRRGRGAQWAPEVVDAAERLWTGEADPGQVGQSAAPPALAGGSTPGPVVSAPGVAGA